MRNVTLGSVQVTEIILKHSMNGTEVNFLVFHFKCVVFSQVIGDSGVKIPENINRYPTWPGNKQRSQISDLALYILRISINC